MTDSRESDFLSDESTRPAWEGLGEPDMRPGDSSRPAPLGDVTTVGLSGDSLDDDLDLDPLPITSRAERKALKGSEVSMVRWVVETVGLLLLALVLAQGIKTFLVQPYIVPTGSMIPTIQINDRVLANKLVYWVGTEPAQGDVVVLDDPTGQFDMLVKRVVAVGGQTVDLQDGQVLVDGERLIEPYVHGQPTEMQMQSFPYEVPEGDVLVLGDNRTNSADSRTFGSVSVDSIRGRAFWTYWPMDRFGALR